MLLSILYRFVRCLLGLNAVLARQDLSKDAELLVSRQGNDPPRRPSGRPPTAVAIKKSRDSQGSRESHLETPAGAGRTDPTRPSHRRLHRVADWTVLDLVDTGRDCR
jgi:hypothetical protein